MNELSWKALSKAVKRYQDVLSWSRSDRHSPGAERELAAAARNIRKAIGEQETGDGTGRCRMENYSIRLPLIMDEGINRPVHPVFPVNG
ncbi:hypothetical protein [Escherichia coli]|uniref:hypothetical protein n=1 Tax=Escherichia coli TaxID=562 RepID=UPI0021C21CE4|nr:hypothetical protein [Escherichia coli]MCT8916419.1 hypothetical protein [Escherichia coli]